MAESAAAAACWSCTRALDAADRYCRHCGKGQAGHVPYYYKHAGILLLTLCALGPFALYLVWRSPVLSRPARWVYTGLIAAFTWWLIVTTHGVYTTVMGQLDQLGLL